MPRTMSTRSAQPFEEEWHALARTDWKAGCAFGVKSGREASVEEMNALFERADRLFERMQAVPALTQPGRAAKVRALLVHVMRSEWRGPLDDMDREQARALLGEFAGMTAEELAAI
jgi:hypothetical protein